MKRTERITAAALAGLTAYLVTASGPAAAQGLLSRRPAASPAGGSVSTPHSGNGRSPSSMTPFAGRSPLSAAFGPGVSRDGGLTLRPAPLSPMGALPAGPVFPPKPNPLRNGATQPGMQQYSPGTVIRPGLPPSASGNGNVIRPGLSPNPYNGNAVVPGLSSAPSANVIRPGLPQTGPRQAFVVNGPPIIIDDCGATFFRGYKTIYVPGQTYLSPFGVYNCPRYIAVNHVVASPYVYANGREVGVYRPYAYGDRDPDPSAGADRGRLLRAALNDLALYWEENDTRALRRRVLPDVAVAVFQGERHVYSLRQSDFLDLSRDALDRVTTLSFRFHAVRDRTDGLVNAYATHSYRVRSDGTTRTATARYTLVYVDGDWYVSAVSLSPEVGGY